MKKTAISAAVFEKLSSTKLQNIAGGELQTPLLSAAGLTLIPWFCDESVQWALRISEPGKTLKKSLLKKVNDSFITEEAGTVLIGIPGDGIEPSTYTLFPLVEALAAVLHPGMLLEVAAANLGVVKRDWELKSETLSDFGDQRYAGLVNSDGTWSITQSTPVLTRSQLETALACGQLVAKNGPWKPRDRTEARSILLQWMKAPEANINPMAVKRFITFRDGEFQNSDPDMIRKLCGLGLGFFRERLPNGPFSWRQEGFLRHSDQTYEEVADFVLS